MWVFFSAFIVKFWVFYFTQRRRGAEAQREDERERQGRLGDKEEKGDKEDKEDKEDKGEKKNNRGKGNGDKETFFELCTDAFPERVPVG
ncbi:MAG: hypothetical protein MUD14_04665 [Hydrococcus sp. Prado102]|jgi:hypothetical protein|nr:hypothetical protein [Hydrococcus sp. Prado102]